MYVRVTWIEASAPAPSLFLGIYVELGTACSTHDWHVSIMTRRNTARVISLPMVVIWRKTTRCRVTFPSSILTCWLCR